MYVLCRCTGISIGAVVCGGGGDVVGSVGIGIVGIVGIGSLFFFVSISLFVASVSIKSFLLDATVYCEKENS